MTNAPGLEAAPSRLEARNLQKSYGRRKVVQDVSLSVAKGEVVGLLGPNGAGKTTSFYMIVGLVRADDGQITIDGQPVEHMPIHRRSRLGLSYLPQEPSIFRGLTGEQNLLAILETLPLDRAPIDCARSTQSAGSAISRFVEGRGGALKRADFRAVASAPRAAAKTSAVAAPVVLSDPEAAGAGRDWLAGQAPGIEWLFPATDHNPRSKAIRAAIKHVPGQTVTLRINGKAADPLTFEGTSKSADGSVAVSLWRGLEIREGENRLIAEVKDVNGVIITTLERDVHYSITPMRASLVRERSVLVADGVTRPVLAVRLTDRDGKPVRAGLTGDFSVPAP